MAYICKCEDWDDPLSLELERLAKAVDHTTEIIRTIPTQTDSEPCTEFVLDLCVCDDSGEPKGQCANCGADQEDHLKTIVTKTMGSILPPEVTEAGIRISEDMTDVFLQKHLGTSRDLENWFKSRPDHPYKDLLLKYVNEEIDSVDLIFIVMKEIMEKDLDNLKD